VSEQTEAAAEDREPAVAVKPAEQSLLDAFGGRKGILDSGLPLVLFVAVYLSTDRNMQAAVIVAIAAGVVLAIVQVAMRRPVQFAIAGLVSVAIAAYIAGRTGEARNIFLPTILWNIGYAIAYAASVLLRWPLVGVVVGAATQNMDWRKDPVLLRAYNRATWILAGSCIVRLIVLVPLYYADALGVLAVAKVVLGVPLYAVAIWACFLVVRNATRAKHGEAPITA
jgi:hypothetical protein